MIEELSNKLHHIALEGLDQSDFDFAKAIGELLKAYKKLKKRQEANYKGYDLSESYLTSCVQPLKETLTLDGIEYHGERDRDIFHVIVMCAMQLGINEGIKIGRSKGRSALAMELINQTKKSKED